MSHTPVLLEESLQRLRDASLPAGFEARLAERLEQAHRERKATVLRIPRSKRVLLLLAAVALPVAAFASHGSVLERLGFGSSQQPRSTVKAKLLQQHATALSGPTVIAQPSLSILQGASVSAQFDLIGGSPRLERLQPKSRPTQPQSEPVQFESSLAQPRPEPVQVEREADRALHVPAVPSALNLPTRIEPVEASIPGAPRDSAASGSLAKSGRAASSSLLSEVDRGDHGLVNERGSERPGTRIRLR